MIHCVWLLGGASQSLEGFRVTIVLANLNEKDREILKTLKIHVTIEKRIVSKNFYGLLN